MCGCSLLNGVWKLDNWATRLFITFSVTLLHHIQLVPYMAAKLLLAPLSSSSSSSKIRIYQNQHHGHPWLPSYRAQLRRKASVRVSLDDPAFSASCYQTLFTLADTTGYSQASYYTSLGLFVISVPGLWSLIKRSVKSKVYMNSCFVRTYICSFSSKEKWVREVPICQ